MEYRVKVSPVAKDNINESLRYYKKEVSIKVAKNFIKDVEESLMILKRYPFFQIHYMNFRGLPLKKYPYIIFYQVDEIGSKVLINALFHTNQDISKRP